MYTSKYESGGHFWPIVHNTTIFSLAFMQVIALGVFGLRKSPVASGFTIPLFICTLLFNEYCRQRFHPIFQSDAAEVANSELSYLFLVHMCNAPFVWFLIESGLFYLFTTRFLLRWIDEMSGWEGWKTFTNSCNQSTAIQKKIVTSLVDLNPQINIVKIQKAFGIQKLSSQV